jgi:hypothetical protein
MMAVIGESHPGSTGETLPCLLELRALEAKTPSFPTKSPRPRKDWCCHFGQHPTRAEISELFLLSTWIFQLCSVLFLLRLSRTEWLFYKMIPCPNLVL